MSKLPDYMFTRKFLFLTVLFIVVFSILFLQLYSPFSSTYWFTLRESYKLLGTVTMYAFSIVGYGCCVGAGDTLVPSMMNFCSMWLVRILLALVLTPRMGLTGYWIAMCAELNIRGLLFLWRLKGDRWMKHKAFAGT